MRESSKSKLKPTPSSNSTEMDGEKEQLTYRPEAGRSIVRHARTWSGDDFEECLQAM